jgi:hypothetical protein
MDARVKPEHDEYKKCHVTNIIATTTRAVRSASSASAN